MWPFRTPNRLHKVVSPICSTLFLLSLGCVTKNGLYCTDPKDCESGDCVGYEPNVRAGTCMEPIGLSSKQCTLIVRCVDGSMPTRSFGQYVTIVSLSSVDSNYSLVGAFDQGVSACSKSTMGAIKDILDSVGNPVPPGPIAALSTPETWISVDPTQNRAFHISTSASPDGNQVIFPAGSRISSVAASKSWLGVADATNRYLWLWKTSAFSPATVVPSVSQYTETQYGKTIAISDSQIAVKSATAVHLYDIDSATKPLREQTIKRPDRASADFGSSLGLSALGLFVSENTQQSIGRTIWWYPKGSQEAQAMPIPSRYSATNQPGVLGYGSTLSTTDTRIALGIPGQADVVVIERASDTWQELRLDHRGQAPSQSSRFGAALAMDGNLLAVGAPGEGSIYVYDCK